MSVRSSFKNKLPVGIIIAAIPIAFAACDQPRFSTSQAALTRNDSALPYCAGQAAVAVRFAWGATGQSAWDGSGLTSAAWSAAGQTLSSDSREQWAQVAHVSPQDLRPGDLVFFAEASHVALYVGNDQIIHAPAQGAPVAVAPIDYSAIYGCGRPGLIGQSDARAGQCLDANSDK
jgi:cell wall-associated NlpC family hydrolase